MERAARSFLIGVNAEALPPARVCSRWTNVAEAEFALVRMHAPFGPVHQGYFFGSRQHEGDLDFKPGDEQMEALSKLPAKSSGGWRRCIWIVRRS